MLSSALLSVFTTTAQTIDPGDAIVFDQTRLLLDAGDFEVLGTGEIVINEAGVYELSYGYQTATAGTFAAAFTPDGGIPAPLPGTTYLSLVSDQDLNTFVTLFVVPDGGGTLFIGNAGLAPHVIGPADTPTVTAFLNLVKVR